MIIIHSCKMYDDFATEFTLTGADAAAVCAILHLPAPVKGLVANVTIQLEGVDSEAISEGSSRERERAALEHGQVQLFTDQ